MHSIYTYDGTRDCKQRQTADALLSSPSDDQASFQTPGGEGKNYSTARRSMQKRHWGSLQRKVQLAMKPFGGESKSEKINLADVTHKEEAARFELHNRNQ